MLGDSILTGFTDAVNALAWQERALCAQTDPALWFPASGISHKAKAICRACPVLQECREYALADESLVGIWGATSTAERDTYRRVLRDARGEVAA